MSWSEYRINTHYIKGYNLNEVEQRCKDLEKDYEYIVHLKKVRHGEEIRYQAVMRRRSSDSRSED